MFCMNGRHFRGIFFLTTLYHCSGSMTYFWESLPTIFPERNSKLLPLPPSPPRPPHLLHFSPRFWREAKNFLIVAWIALNFKKFLQFYLLFTNTGEWHTLSEIPKSIPTLNLYSEFSCKSRFAKVDFATRHIFGNPT